MNSSSVSQPRALSMNRFLHPGLLIAIALHAILLWFPLTSNSESAASKTEAAQSTTTVNKESDTTSDTAPSPTEPTTQTVTPLSPTTKPIAASKAAVTPALAPAPTQKTNAVIKPPLKTTATQTAPSRPTPKPTMTSPTVPVPKTVPTFSRPAPFSIAKVTVQPSPAPSPTPTASPSPTVSPILAASPAPAPKPSPAANSASAPPIVAIAPTTIPIDPFTKLPFYPFGRSLMGSMGLQPWEQERETYAFNTRETMKEAIAFYQETLPKEIFEPLKVEAEGENLTIYEVKPKNGGKSRYLHFIPFQGRTAIVLLPEKISDVESLKKQAVVRQEERRQFFGIFSQMERIRQQMRSNQFSKIE